MVRVLELTSVQQLLEAVRSYLPPERLAFVEEAYRFAEEAHRGQRRLSGEPYIEHPVSTALYLANLRLDATALAAALLHDVVEDCGVPRELLKERFGPEVAKLVDGVTKLAQVERRDGGRGTQDPALQAENLRKMLLAMAEDIRVVLIKLADRLHNMQTLGPLPEDRRLAIAQETLDIYAPLAHRLGIWDVKWQLEDLAFQHLDPEEHQRIAALLATNRAEREQYIQHVVETLQQELAKAGVHAEVAGRPKQLYSIYQKIQKYAAQGKEFGQIYDLYAVRVLVDTVQECYGALGVVHQLWRPLQGQIDDYIAVPKENLYQSLHTAVMCLGNTPLEIQIRTHEMHRLAEYGVAAHWRYKEGGAGDPGYEQKMAWLRQLLEWQREVSGAEEFLETVKMDLFRDQVFVYTPKGDVKELPAGSTPLDFAYRVHTDLGHRCIGAKVNGKLVSLTHQVQNGDTIEIMASKGERGPSLDWLNPHLGYTKTAGARQAIRAWFHRQAREANVQRGKDLLHREIKRLRLSLKEEEVAHLLRVDTVEELFLALGSGALSTAQVTARLTEHGKPAEEMKIALPLTGPASGVEVLGVGSLLSRMAPCCSPLPGDEIVGYVTRARGMTIHRRDCTNLINEDEPERIMAVNWGDSKELYPARVRIEAWDRVGLLRDITTVVSGEGVNIASVVTRKREDSTFVMDLTLHTTGLAQLSRLFSKLDGVEGFISVARTGRSPLPLRGRGHK